MDTDAAATDVDRAVDTIKGVQQTAMNMAMPDAATTESSNLEGTVLLVVFFNRIFSIEEPTEVGDESGGESETNPPPPPPLVQVPALATRGGVRSHDIGDAGETDGDSGGAADSNAGDVDSDTGGDSSGSGGAVIPI